MREKRESPFQKGAYIVQSYLKTLPERPGVYRMLDKDGNILYVGKAKNLPKRVQSYTQFERLSHRIRLMVSRTTQMEFSLTETEAQALILEATLIKKHRPPYNILMRDDKMFAFLHLTVHEAPLLEKYRGNREEGGLYFGPFASTVAVNETLDTLHKVFRLRSCSDNVYASRKRPCIQYQIKRCSAPCVRKISLEDYHETVRQATLLLKGQSHDVQRLLQKHMEHASEMQAYEQAAVYRDKLKALQAIQARNTEDFIKINNGDIFHILRASDTTMIQLTLVREGLHCGHHKFFPSHDPEVSLAEVLSAFLSQFYLSLPIPSQIVTNIAPAELPLLEQALSPTQKVRIKTPTREPLLRIIKSLEATAQLTLHHYLERHTAQREHLKALGELMGFEKAPKRVEVYDNSHLFGKFAYGAMIVVGEEGFDKKHYRLFKVDPGSAAGGDDYDMMRQVMMRRLKALTQESQDTWPDLILLDGGLGQLNAALDMMKELGVAVPLLAIAKGPDRNAGRERFFRVAGEEFSLQEGTPLLYFLQRIRDEAHRFAIQTHRRGRQKSTFKSVLDQVPGIGPKRKKTLLAHFGSAKSVQEASLAELKQVAGIQDHIAAQIYGFFHSK